MTDPARRALLAKVHLAAKGLALADESYRAILKRIGGAESAAGIDDAGLVRVVEEFKRLGWNDAKRAFKPSGKPHVRMVWRLWGELSPASVRNQAAGLRGFCKRVVGIEEPEWLTPEQGNKVIEALKARLARARAAAAADAAEGVTDD
jgi:phage gp16-like protein